MGGVKYWRKSEAKGFQKNKQRNAKLVAQFKVVEV